MKFAIKQIERITIFDITDIKNIAYYGLECMTTEQRGQEIKDCGNNIFKLKLGHK